MTVLLSLNVWRDTGYSEGGLEVPTLSSKLPDPDYTFHTLRPAKGRLFSEIRVDAPYFTLYDCTYISALFTTNNVTEGRQGRTFYGWIDSVEPLSDNDGAPLTLIRWHIDLWRTFAPIAQFGSGLVTRRAKSSDKEQPPQDIPYRYRYVSEYGQPRPIISSTSTWYIILTYNTVTGTDDSKTTQSSTGYVPVSITNPSSEISECPSLNSFIDGTWDELLGLDPDAVKGVFLSPIPPVEESKGRWSYSKVAGASKGLFKATGAIDSFDEYTWSDTTGVMSDDYTSYVVTGFDGETVGTLPWGVKVTEMKYRLIVESTSAYIQIRAHGLQSHLYGTCFTIPLIPIEVTGNSWSSYVYSGARQADIQQRITETSKNLTSGLASTANQAIQGAASGAMLGSIGGPLGLLGGAALGGVTSALGTAMDTVSTAMISSEYNDRFQDIEDYRHAHQTDGLIMSGSGFDCLRYGQKGIYIRAYSVDSYAAIQSNRNIDLYGVKVNEAMTSTQSLVSAGGPLSIRNLTVTGPIPNEARRYIKSRLESGVRMI